MQRAGSSEMCHVACHYASLKLLASPYILNVPLDATHCGLVVQPKRSERVREIMRHSDVREWVKLFRISPTVANMLRQRSFPSVFVTVMPQCLAMGIPEPSLCLPCERIPQALTPIFTLETTILQGQHSVFKPEVVLKTWQFRNLLRNGRDFRLALQRAWECSMRPDDAAKLKLALASGQLRMPSTTVLQKTETRLCY